VFDTGEITWKRSKDGSQVDMEALCRDFPELATRYQKVKPGSRRFLVV
jgi:hypothetical protein